ncbi:BREX-1 system adenine-specific DNA-methyltransferase PglX [Escherichia fergusonii]|uniref:BREX-1 system adenine-specific DNA-methyltransferase PglX n=1 Tax=Escherichia fergusonii TaxID=564 RepID=UPI0015D7D31F|nr:BREX-1 system adenine-specific DNA-methyltransferase PglX [Escherichia fergusonii]
MNTNNIKKYAPQARNDFRDAVIQKLTTLGIAADKKGNLQIAEAETIGETVRYGQFDYPLSTLPRRERLVKRAREQGFEVLVEHCAYTWFNRLCAIRYMELHGYLDHGFRMLSHPETPNAFEVLDHVPEVAEALLPENQAQLVEMKLSGNQDEALYRELLLGQCHALHHAMPFLFEAVDDEAELLLPDNLTRTDSILRGLVDDIPEEDWEQVEVIGWLYQFYISEKKDAVIGKVVKSEDIPAATQLFTPNWIVQYLVQNSVGRQWLQTYPDSPLKDKMEYYIEPAEQTPEVQAQLAAITPASIEPESIKVLDPACGSGHILIEAYNVLKNIYEERGYRGRDIPQLILENNIFGLDIDDRAAQLSGFALLMMARQDDRRIFTRDVRLNILSLQESLHLDIAKLWQQLNFHQQVQTGSMGDMFAENTALTQTDSAEYQLLLRTLKRFVNANTLGSLIQVPQEEEAELKVFLDALYRLEQEGDFQQKAAAKAFIPFIQQAWILAQRYDAVVANPPYMGGKYLAPAVKNHLKENFSGYDKDLFSAFIIRNLQLSQNGAQLGFMTPFVWMFISSYEELRLQLINNDTIISLIQLEYSGFDGATVPICTFTLQKNHIPNFSGSYIRLSDFRGAANQGPRTLEAINNKDCSWRYQTNQESFKKIPGSPIAFWIKHQERNLYQTGEILGDIASPKKGLDTGENEVFLRLWHEVSLSKSCYDNSDHNKKWYPYNKGGEFRKWYGNRDYLINWENNGEEIKSRSLWVKKKPTIRNQQYYFKPGMTWTTVSSGGFSARYCPEGALFDNGGCTLFTDKNIDILGAFLNSCIAARYLEFLSPTLNFQPGDIGRILFPKILLSAKIEFEKCVEIAKKDWNLYETSWDFLKSPLITLFEKKIQDTFVAYKDNCEQMSINLKKLEEHNNAEFDSYLLLNCNYNVELEKISLFSNVRYRYKDMQEKNECHNRFRSESLTDLLSYIVGCQMGRYSLDREGLVYAHEGNKGFADLVAEGAYKTFPADSDGILPLMDDEWFDDDVTSRVKEFVRTVWGEEHLQENLEFIAESLCLYAIKQKKGESALETIRRYLSTQFWKDHMKMYKKRPIYWLFSSGKEKAFECLVYLHRYNDATLSRMRTEYVVPLLARYQANIDRLSDQLDEASGGEATRLKRERDSLIKKFSELRSYDDRLRHYADMRISIDLDDGVKVNYGKFGDLLADVKAITGNAPKVI